MYENCKLILQVFSINFYVMETFLANWLEKSVFLSGNSHLLGGLNVRVFFIKTDCFGTNNLE